MYFANDFPIFIAGDFNDVPESDSIQNQMETEFIDLYSMKDIHYPRAPYNMTQIKQFREDMKGKKDENDSSIRIKPHRNYPEFTTYKYRKKEGGFIQRTIDYVFASREEAAARLEVVGWLEPPADDTLDKEMASPCID